MRFVLGGCLLGLPTLCQASGGASRIETTAPLVDEYGSGGWRSFSLSLPADRYVHIEASPTLEDPDWKPLAEPVLSPAERIDLHAQEDRGAHQRFYRAITRPLPVSLVRIGDAYRLTVVGPLSAGDAIDYLGRRFRTDVFLNDAGDRSEEISPGEYIGRTVEELAAQFGVGVWTPAFEHDDPAHADLFTGDPNGQDRPLPDNEPGNGAMDDGWSGDDIKDEPSPGPDDPEVDPESDMPLAKADPDPPPEDDLEPSPSPPEPGVHLRVAIAIRQDGAYQVQSVYEAEGDALLNAPFPLPAPGNIVVVVRSPVGAPTQPGTILHIGTAPNPFEQRAYEPPDRGAHGSKALSSGTLYLAVPVPEDEGRAVLEGLSVELLLVTDDVDLELLTPTAFLSQEGAFDLLALLTEDDLRPLSVALTTSASTDPPPSMEPRSAASYAILHRSGPNSKKFNFVIIGDGFDNSAEDQNTFRTYVDQTVMRNFFRRDIHPEILNAINVFRIDAVSMQSGISLVDSNGIVNVTNAVNTAMQYRYSGLWERCWMEETPAGPGEIGTFARLQALVNTFVPEFDQVAVVLNIRAPGGCARGQRFAVTLDSGWGTFAHEFGHSPGGLLDEYQCSEGGDTCGEYDRTTRPAAPNQENVLTRAHIKWGEWIPSWRPIPTAATNVASFTQDVGLFAGATIGQFKWWTGIYRPSMDGRMRSNTPDHNPVGYTRMRTAFRPWQEGNFRKTVAGNFSWRGGTGLVLIDDRQLSHYESRERFQGSDDPVLGRPPREKTAILHPTWFNTGNLRDRHGTRRWIVRKNDILLPGDFDGDGRDDLYVVNLVDWPTPRMAMLRATTFAMVDQFEPVRTYLGNLPGWEMRPGDRFHVADIDGDGRDDLLVYNGSNWARPYFLMLRSDGNELNYVRRYDRFLPGWEMGRHETFHIGDYDGDGLDDLAVMDARSWRRVHFRIYRATGNGLQLKTRHYGDITDSGGTTQWTLRRADRIYPLDYDGDGTTDLAFFNGTDWTSIYLGLFRLENSSITWITRYDSDVARLPGWRLHRKDRFYAGDVNGDRMQDLVVFNGHNWSAPLLGQLRSRGDGTLQGSFQSSRIGAWSFSPTDDFHVANLRGGLGLDDLMVFNKEQIGLLRSHYNHYRMEAIYPKWIRNHRFHAAGHW